MPARLTPAQRAHVDALIKGHFVALAVQLYGAEALPPAALAEAVRLGLVTPEQAAPGLRGAAGDAYLLGYDEQRKAEPGFERPAEPPEEFEARAEAIHAALSPWEKKMAAAARERGASLVVGLGNQVAADFSTTLISSDNEQARQYRRVIAEETASAIEARESWRRLRGTLGEKLGEDWARDLHRIAATEIQAAVNAGACDAIEEDVGHEALVAVVPNPDACDVCRRFYLQDGKPRIFALDELPQYGVNFKKPKAQWVACVPPSHPWCHCQTVYVPDGWGFDDDWALQPPGTPLQKAAEAPDRSTWVMVPLPESLRSRFVAAGQPDPHVTLLYVGDVGRAAWPGLRAAVEREAAVTAPFRVRVGGAPRHFISDAHAVAHAPVEAPDLDGLHRRLNGALAAAGIHAEHDYEYTPHVTLAYLPPAARWAGDVPSGLFTADAIVIRSPWGTARVSLGTGVA